MSEEREDCGCRHGEHEGCCGGHGHGEHEGCCGGHGHGEHEGCCGDKNANDEFDYSAADVPLPPPTLITFATTLAQQAMVSMGIIKNPMTNKSVIMLNQASYLISTIEMVIEKTQGNRTDEETQVLNNILHELRMLYVAASTEKQRRDEGKK